MLSEELVLLTELELEVELLATVAVDEVPPMPLA